MTVPSSRFGLPMVYLVDDEDVVRDALAWLLRSRRLLSEGFGSGEAFLTHVTEKLAATDLGWPSCPSCVLLDVRMPGMHGMALFEQLIER
jgi:two-component system, LuxR family, response regulator DctR